MQLSKQKSPSSSASLTIAWVAMAGKSGNPAVVLPVYSFVLDAGRVLPIVPVEGDVVTSRVGLC